VHPSGPQFIRYHHVDPEQADIEVGFPVPAPVEGAGRVWAGALPGGTVAVTAHWGSHETLPTAYAALAQWLEAQGHHPMETAPGRPLAGGPLGVRCASECVARLRSGYVSL
jgi:effector-binding domain-containing protein